MAKTYFTANVPQVTTAAPVPITTGTAIKTLLQIETSCSPAKLRSIKYYGGMPLSALHIVPSVVEIEGLSVD